MTVSVKKLFNYKQFQVYKKNKKKHLDFQNLPKNQLIINYWKTLFSLYL